MSVEFIHEFNGNIALLCNERLTDSKGPTRKYSHFLRVSMDKTEENEKVLGTIHNLRPLSENFYGQKRRKC